jgi:hypothetical protein
MPVKNSVALFFCINTLLQAGHSLLSDTGVILYCFQ